MEKLNDNRYRVVLTKEEVNSIRHALSGWNDMMNDFEDEMDDDDARKSLIHRLRLLAKFGLTVNPQGYVE